MISFLAIGFLASCGNNSTETTSGPDDTAGTTQETVAPTVDPEIDMGLELIASKDCLTCHKVDEPLVGPTYKSVATKYKDSSSVIIDTLANRIIKGSVGHWGQIPMTPHLDLSPDSARMMVKYVLSLN